MEADLNLNSQSGTDYMIGKVRHTFHR